MTAPNLGPWSPLSLTDTVEAFGEAPFRWWISGGRALELQVGRSWRDHDDTDVGVLRRDAAGLREVLHGWDIHVAAAGRLDPWMGQALRPELHQNNLWCRRRRTSPWCLDVTISEGDGEAWVYRRDPRIRIEWGQAMLRTAEGVPYLAPELQLLFKSKDVHPKDDVDARQVIPDLGGERRERLARLLSVDLLGSGGGGLPEPARPDGTIGGARGRRKGSRGDVDHAHRPRSGTPVGRVLPGSPVEESH